MLRKIFVPKMEEIIGGWRILHYEELHNVEIRMRGRHVQFQWESQKGKDHCEDVDIDGRIIS
jgi:hypothetical protein